MTEMYLEHYGVKGMKWGVRKEEQYVSNYNKKKQKSKISEYDEKERKRDKKFLGDKVVKDIEKKYGERLRVSRRET